MGLAAWFKLNDDATDSSGGGHDGTAANVSYVAGKVGQAGSFNGSSSKVTVTGLMNSITAMSFACWVNCTTPQTNARIAESRDNADPNPGWILYIPANGVPVAVIDAGATYVAANGPAGSIKSGTWRHVAFVWNGATITVYVDGVAGTPVAYTGTVTKTATTVIGNGSQATAYWYSGLIDDVRIYDSALSLSQIRAIWGSGRGTDLAAPDIAAKLRRSA
jgi:hypothetical protein